MDFVADFSAQDTPPAITLSPSVGDFDGPRNTKTPAAPARSYKCGRDQNAAHTRMTTCIKNVPPLHNIHHDRGECCEGTAFSHRPLVFMVPVCVSDAI
jgi:hypothetical protein